MSARIIRLAASSFVLATAAAAQGVETGPVPVQSISIAFKLDPRLTGGTYGGEQWVSPPTFSSPAQGGSEATIETRVQSVDARGRAASAKPRWVVAEPDMVEVQARGEDVYAITVKRPGESRLEARAGGASLELTVTARRVGEALQVDITKQHGAPTAAESPAQPPASAEPKSLLPDDAAANSYALGLATGRKLKLQFPTLQGDLVTRGVTDALAGNAPLASEEQIRAALARLGAEALSARAKARQELAERNKAAGDAFLATNKAKPGVVTLPSGVQYSVIKAGSGRKPAATDTVVCHYRGRFVDGTEFDSSYSRGKPATFALGRVIPGWKEALALMPTGSQWQIVVPAALAYGARGTGRIGPNATLAFEVELLSIEAKAAASPLPPPIQTSAAQPATP
jgi:FKBP-type peptidyl-prolyl cis-trans isomerase